MADAFGDAVRLPDITYGSVPDEVAPAEAQAGAAAQRLSDVVSQGLTAYGQELVKTQQQQATVDLQKRLNDTETAIRESPYVPVSKLKEEFGEDLEGLPDPVREHVRQISEKFASNPSAFEQLEQPLGAAGAPLDLRRPADPLIPTFFVAGSLYDKRAKEALEQASGHITTGQGWQAAFQNAAQEHIAQRQGRLGLEQAHAALEYFSTTHEQQAKEAAAAGDFSGALGIVSRSEALPPQKKQELRHQIGVLADTKDAYDAMRMVAVPATSSLGLKLVDEQLSKVNDPNSFTTLTPKERDTLAHELRSASMAYHSIANQREAAQLAFGYADGARDEQNPMRVNPEKAFDALDADFRAGKFKGREELWPEIRRVLQEHIKDRNEASKLELGNVQGDAMGQFMSIGPDGKPNMSFSNVQPDTLRQLHRFGKEGEATIEQLLKWEQANESHARNMRQLPTAAESAKAFTIERELAVHPGKYRAMSTGDLLGILTGTYQDPTGAIPPGPVSAKDLPHLSELIAKNSAPVKTEHVTNVAGVAFEEAENAFPSLRANAKHPNKAPEDTRKAFQLLKDKLDAFVGANRDAQGNDPSDAKVRDEARRLLKQDVEVRRSFLGIPYTSKTSRIEHEVETGQPPIEPSAAPSPTPAATALKDGEEDWIGPDGKGGERHYAIPANRAKELDPKKWRKAVP